jgi:hypothetical protein
MHGHGPSFLSSHTFWSPSPSFNKAGSLPFNAASLLFEDSTSSGAGADWTAKENEILTGPTARGQGVNALSSSAFNDSVRIQGQGEPRLGDRGLVFHS